MHNRLWFAQTSVETWRGWLGSWRMSWFTCSTTALQRLIGPTCATLHALRWPLTPKFPQKSNIFKVRAANLAHCLGPVSGFMRDGAPLLEGHAACVKAKASRSVELVGKVSKKEAEQVVSEVFARCYADLEPLGRRCWGDQEQRRAAREENWRRGRNSWNEWLLKLSRLYV